MKYIAPSVLGCNLSRLFEESLEVLEAGSDWLHLDIMDGHFVPNLSFGPPVVQSLRKSLPSAVFDCHIMASNPLQWITPLALAGASIFTFHIETVDSQENLETILNLIRKNRLKAGIAVKPNTEISQMLLNVINLGIVDMVLIMTVEPGFGGQPFIHNMMEKVQFLRNLYPDLIIEVDGGINMETIAVADKAGANAFVVGTFVFNSMNRGDVLQKLRKTVDN